MGFIAGRYSATWNALATGQTRDGFRTNHQILKRVITGDAAGQTPQDAVYQGFLFECNFVLIEYDAAAVATIMWPNGGTKWGIGNVGQLDVIDPTGVVAARLAKPLVLTRVAANPPMTATPATLTIVLAALKENFPVELLYAPDLREVPLSMRGYLNNSGVFAVET